MVLDSRLLRVNSSIAERISNAPESTRRAIAATAAIEAIARQGLDDRTVVVAALNALNANQYGDTAVRTALMAAADDEEVAGLADEDSDIGVQHDISANALRALAYALDADSETAAHDGMYEAIMTTDEIGDDIRQKVRAILDSE